MTQVRELLSQSDEQDQAPNISDQVIQGTRLVIADLFQKDDQARMQAVLSTYFDIEDVIDISINVQKSINKQRDRQKKFLSTHGHADIVCETLRQLLSQIGVGKSGILD